MSTALANEPYEQTYVRVGLLGTRFEVPAVRMPRERFLAIVKRTLQNEFDDTPELYAALREELLPVARQMPRFPLQTWVSDTRGCGCVVGEYLIAHGEQSRRELADDTRRLGQSMTVDRLLNCHPLGNSLRLFGIAIDTAIVRELDTAGLIDENGDKIDNRACNVIESVEIIDDARVKP
jgi:hypothetical protein